MRFLIHLYQEKRATKWMNRINVNYRNFEWCQLCMVLIFWRYRYEFRIWWYSNKNV